MKKMYLLAVLMAAAMPFTSMAQDHDLYFNPKKEAKEKAERKAALLREYKAQQARRDSIYAPLLERQQPECGRVQPWWQIPEPLRESGY